MFQSWIEGLYEWWDILLLLAPFLCYSALLFFFSILQFAFVRRTVLAVVLSCWLAELVRLSLWYGFRSQIGKIGEVG